MADNPPHHTSPLSGRRGVRPDQILERSFVVTPQFDRPRDRARWIPRQYGRGVGNRHAAGLEKIGGRSKATRTFHGLGIPYQADIWASKVWWRLRAARGGYRGTGYLGTPAQRLFESLRCQRPAARPRTLPSVVVKAGGRACPCYHTPKGTRRNPSWKYPLFRLIQKLTNATVYTPYAHANHHRQGFQIR